MLFPSIYRKNTINRVYGSRNQKSIIELRDIKCRIRGISKFAFIEDFYLLRNNCFSIDRYQNRISLWHKVKSNGLTIKKVTALSSIPMGGDDIFVHFSNIDSHHRFKLLKQDADVVFELDNRGKRLQAKKVREISSAKSRIF